MQSTEITRDEWIDALTGKTVDVVEVSDEAADYIVLRFGELTLYADAPTLYARPPAEVGYEPN